MRDKAGCEKIKILTNIVHSNKFLFSPMTA